MRNYHVLRQIGGGAFGTVYKARNKTSRKIVALKKVFCAWTREEGQHYQQRHATSASSGGDRRSIPPRVMREIIALKYLRMENVVHLLEMFPNGSHVVLVFEYMPTNLREILSHYQLTCTQQKKYALMLMLGLGYIHGVRIIHRDLKPENLLVDACGVLKIADFGLCRLMSMDAAVRYENQAGTRHYRAPEVIFGSQTYNDRADIWSAGCVIYEMACGKPFLWADDDIDIAVAMLHVFGLPNLSTAAQVDDLKEHFPDLFKVTFELPNSPSKRLKTVLSHQCDDAHMADMISVCLTFFPWQRPSAKHVLQAEAFVTAPLPAAVQDLPDISTLRHGPQRFTTFKTAPLARRLAGAKSTSSGSSSDQSFNTLTSRTSNDPPVEAAEILQRKNAHANSSRFEPSVVKKKLNVSSVFEAKTAQASVTNACFPVNDVVTKRQASASVKSKLNLDSAAASAAQIKLTHTASLGNSSSRLTNSNRQRPGRAVAKNTKKGHMAWY